MVAMPRRVICASEVGIVLGEILFTKWKLNGVSWYGATFAGGFSNEPEERLGFEWPDSEFPLK